MELNPLIFVGMLCGLVASARADSITFNFNSLSSGGNAAQMASYMTTALQGAGCPKCSVTVTGAVADQTYNGEGHVVGSHGKSLTLGTSDGATNNSTLTPSTTYDTFIANTSDQSTNIASQMTLLFTGLTIDGAAGFDYEIFPDGTCSQLTSKSCGGKPTGGIYPNQPDLTFEAGTGTKGTDPVVSSFGTDGTQYGVTPSATGSDGSSIHSPASPPSKNSKTVKAELAPQYIGTWSGTLADVTELDFIDWPATIGIDNLSLTFDPVSPVPEPGSIIFLGTALVGLGLALVRKVRN